MSDTDLPTRRTPPRQPDGLSQAGTGDGNPPQQDAAQGQLGCFLAYLIEDILANPRTKAQIGSVIRGVLIAVGSSWAATHAQGIDLIAGILLAVASAVWGIYQKYRVDRKIGRMKTEAHTASIRAVVAEIRADAAQKVKVDP